MRIINVPIEPIPMRYSVDWERWFTEYYNEEEVDYISINPAPIKNTIEKGSFLDICTTNGYKCNQMRIISGLIDKGEICDGDVFLFHDLWNPTIEMLAYMRDGLGLKIKIVGCLHAGTWDKYDFLSKKSMDKWAIYAEQAWFEIVDAVFVATNFHKNLILETHDIAKYKRKIHVTGFPIFRPNNRPSSWGKRKNWLVFPHRLDSEKNPFKFDILAKNIDGPLVFSPIKTMEKCVNKDQYYDVLCNSKVSVSFAEQETWGIAMIESVLCGCVPYVPNKLSYRELYPSCFKYSGEASTKWVSDILKSRKKPFEEELSKLKEKFLIMGKTAVPNMMKIIYSLE